ncbi:MAG: hypothetical protein ABIL09_18315 [Gemmatimonadota bacterium]
MWNPHLLPQEIVPDAPAPLKPSARERALLRQLARRALEIAHEPVMGERRQAWRDHNALKPGRPLILADPECAWEELVPVSTLECAQPKLRAWELELRKRIFWREVIDDDDTVEPCFDIPWAVRIGDFGVVARKTHGANRGSYTWDPPIRDLATATQVLKARELSVDRALTHDYVDAAASLFGDILPVRIRGKYWWTVGLTQPLIDLIGLETLMLAMVDHPAELHALMAWLRDEHLRFLAWFEQEGLLSDTNENDYVGSGAIAYTDELPQRDRKPGEPVRLKDIWGHCESQETIGVSPGMFAEFVFPYQLPLTEKFGLVCYGCCEPVDQRLVYLKRIPALRRISVSAWADEERCAREMGRDYIYSRKPNPARICASFDEDEIRRDLRHTLETARGCILELVMKDTHTLQHQPWRISRWVQLARQEVERQWSGA